jgi:hypothetical protein
VATFKSLFRPHRRPALPRAPRSGHPAPPRPFVHRCRYKWPALTQKRHRDSLNDLFARETAEIVAPAAFDVPETAAARDAIKAKIADKECYQALIAVRQRGVTGLASQEWTGLHAKGWPAPTGATSQADVNMQAAARTEEQRGTLFTGLNAQWPATPENEAEIRGSVVREEIRNWAVQQRDLLVNDKAFYRRLLGGDMAAKEKWGRVVAIIGLRPVKVQK